MIFGEFAILKENDSLLDNTILLVLLDYFLVYNSLQESIKSADTLAAFSTDHSAITLSLCHLKEFS